MAGACVRWGSGWLGPQVAALLARRSSAPPALEPGARAHLTAPQTAPSSSPGRSSCGTGGWRWGRSTRTARGSRAPLVGEEGERRGQCSPARQLAGRPPPGPLQATGPPSSRACACKLPWRAHLRPCGGTGSRSRSAPGCSPRTACPGRTRQRRAGAAAPPRRRAHRPAGDTAQSPTSAQARWGRRRGEEGWRVWANGAGGKRVGGWLVDWAPR